MEADVELKQSTVEHKRFAREVWNELLRWSLFFLFIVGSITIAVCLDLHIGMSVLLFFIEYLCCLAGAWFFLFIRKPKNKELVADK